MIVRIVLALAFLTPLLPTVSYAGSCDHSWQTAKDGSRCGDRAADQREGGRTGYEND